MAESKIALYLNGIYKSVLKEILKAQKEHPDQFYYLQPYKSERIIYLAESPPTPTTPVRLYLSTTKNLQQISYQAEIVGWEDKPTLTKARFDELDAFIRRFQPEENGIYQKHKGRPCKNLLTIRSLKKVKPPFPVTTLIKISDGKPYKTRTQSGGWATVYELPAETSQLQFRETVEAAFAKEVKEAGKLSSEQRRQKIEAAPKIPERTQVVATVFKRNPYVVAEVLVQAGGKCEACQADAPFIRASDGTPYLEVHHRITLAEGGEDTVENAMAVCPNCHRRFHYGKL